MIGVLPRCPIALAAQLENVEALSLGQVLFEMCTAVDIDLALLPDLMSTYPHVSINGQLILSKGFKFIL